MIVRFGDEDHAGIVYYPRYFHFFHVAFEDFFDQQGLPYSEILDVDKVGFPTAHLETDFRKPLRFGDRFDIDVWVETIGKSSAVFRYRGRRAGDSDDTATARLTVVAVDMRTLRPVPLPDKVRVLFAQNQTPPAA